MADRATILAVASPAPLCDEQGPIPRFPPRALDEHGRLIPISEEERQVRAEATIRALRAIGRLADTDPPM
jgi:hypothetical protein